MCNCGECRDCLRGIVDDLLAAHTAELATRDAALEVAQREREEAREALAAERSAHLASVNIGLAVDDDRGDLQAALAAANERARVAEAALSLAKNDEAHAWRSVRDLREKLAAARAEGERDGLRRAAQVARAARDREDGRLAPDVIANAIEALAAVPIPVPASPPPVLGVAREPKSCGRCGRDWFMARDGVWTVNHREECPELGPRQAAPACPRCKDFTLTKVVNGVTVWQSHAAKGGSPRMWCRESGQPVPTPSEAAAPDPSGAPPGETGGTADCWPLLKGMRVRWHDGSLYEFNGERNSSGGYDIVSLPDRKPAGGLSRSALLEKGARWSFVPAAVPSPTSSATGPASTDLCECGDSAAAHADAFGQFLDCGNGFCSCKQFVRRTRTVEAAAVPPTKDAP